VLDAHWALKLARSTSSALEDSLLRDVLANERLFGTRAKFRSSSDGGHPSARQIDATKMTANAFRWHARPGRHRERGPVGAHQFL
jgi:hypothetical protein